MTVVYGPSVEPGGMKLDDDRYVCECDQCGKETAVHRNWQAAEAGSINSYFSVHCEECGFNDTNDFFYDPLEYEMSYDGPSLEELIGEEPTPPRRMDVLGWLRHLVRLAAKSG